MIDFKKLAHDCENPTYKQGITTTTSAYYEPVYDENGVNINPDRNTTYTSFHCTKCGKAWHVSGNVHDGWEIEEK